MEITVHLQQGPIEVEIVAGQEEDYQEELLDILDFLEDHDSQFTGFLPPSEEATVSKGEVDPNEANESVESDIPQALGRIARKTDVNPEELAKIIDIDPKGEKEPYLILDDTEVLGESRSERQARASLLLLLVWQECYGLETVETSELKEALHMSKLDPDRLYNMYQSMGGDADRYFSRTTGGNPTVKLTRRGERAATDQINDIFNQLKESE